MKKIILSLLLVMLLIPNAIFAATKYEVPVKLEKFGEPGKESMGNPSLKQVAEDQILVAVWVDAMDAIAGGGKGSGEQKAYLKFDWANAKAMEAKDSKPASKKDVKAEKSSAKSEIKIFVSDKEIKPETPAYIENGRTMVPLRFISEALGEKVDWKADTKTVLIGDNKASLVIGEKEIEANGKKIAIDSPAVIKDARTFVPLRAISEILGAKVDWDASTRSVKISK